MCEREREREREREPEAKKGKEFGNNVAERAHQYNVE
jgi:hypothetical protein